MISEMPENDTVTVAMVNGVEGPSLYINDYRVLGPKPWGGGEVIRSWTVDRIRFVGDLMASGALSLGDPEKGDA